LSKHTLTVSYQFDLGSEAYKTVLAKYVTTPSSLPTSTDPGVVFYLPPNADLDEGGSIILDRLGAGTLNLRVVIVLDGTKTHPESVAEYVEKYITELIAKLGLELET
jgi:hypothetical protein